MSQDLLSALWAEDDKVLADQLQLNKQAIRQRLLTRSANAVQRMKWWQRVKVVSHSLLVFALIAFNLLHVADIGLLIAGLSLLGFFVYFLQLAQREHKLLKTIDYSQAITSTQDQLAQLRSVRTAAVKPVFVSAFALWPALCIVLPKVLLGVNVFQVAGYRNVIIYSAICLLLALAIWLVWTLIAKWGAKSSLVKALSQDAAGQEMNAAEYALFELQEFESTEQEIPALSEAEQQHVRRSITRLKRYVWFALLVKSALILCFGWLNATHGGMASWLIPGVALTIFMGTQIGLSVVQRLALKSGIADLHLSSAERITQSFAQLYVGAWVWTVIYAPVGFVALTLLVVQGISAIALAWSWVLVMMLLAVVVSLYLTYKRESIRDVLLTNSALNLWLHIMSFGLIQPKYLEKQR